MNLDDAALPTAEAQLAFLAKLQRLFAEGDFTATYKFALLIAFADLAVELGSDDGNELVLTTRQIGEKFIDLYWKQSVIYGTGRHGSTPDVLIQNPGTQAVVVSAIKEFRAVVSASSPQVASEHPAFHALLTTVTQTVSAQPLKYLQNFGGSTEEFLYDRPSPGRVCLKRGVAYCLRRFQPLVQQIARSHWLAHVKGNRFNKSILGDADDLEEFLFAAPRQSLLALGAALQKLDGKACFYCGFAMSTVDVDHFVPFAQYPRDLVHNFVLAHPGCNRSKSDALAGKRHLEHWIHRLTRRDDDLSGIGRSVGMVADATVSRKVAAWGYKNVLASAGSAWLAPQKYEQVDASHVECCFPLEHRG